jgi:vitamin B12/bleomycin/antimicrobial peptide transport system ATP-binding/permease protein
MQGLGPVFRDAWHLFKPYFLRSEERWRAIGVLVLLVALNLMQVGLSVLLTFWRAQWYNSLQQKDWHTFIQLIFTWRVEPSGSTLSIMPGFCSIAVVFVVLAVYSLWLQQWLQMHWRRWLTTHLIDEWMSDRAYYRISLTADPDSPGTDNPDQRIADDLRDYTADTLALGLDLISNVVSLVSYVAVLWGLSGPLTVFGVTIPGYMVFVALVYAVIGTGLTHWAGRRLVGLRFWQQRLEADFRFSLVRVRENTEGIALYGGEDEERHVLLTRFGRVLHNFRDLMNRTKIVGALTGSYNQVAVVFPFVVAAPRYFAGAIPLGSLIQIGDTFGNVQSSLSWVVNQYPSLASWRATVGRLETFHRAIIAARAAKAQGVQLETTPDQALTMEDVSLTLPDGSVLLNHAHVVFPRGSTTVITGRSGSGKSTLFRALAGIWPFGDGRVRRPAGTYLFLPQRPYLPLGTLRRAVAYPADPASYGQETLEAAMRDVGLGQFIDQLDENGGWQQRLSGGEQQRLALARALLIQPDWLFLDEATSNLDPDAEAQLYAMLRRRLPQTTIVSIAHRPAVAQIHERHLVLQREPGEAGELTAPLPA